MRVLERAGNERGLSRAWRIITNVHFTGCRYLDATHAAEQMIEHARQAGDQALILRALPALATCAQLGPTPVPEAIAIDRAGAVRAGRATRSRWRTRWRALANLEAMRGRFDEARSLYQRSRETLDQLGWHYDAALTSATASGAVELIAGDAVAAEAELRRDHEALAGDGRAELHLHRGGAAGRGALPPGPRRRGARPHRGERADRRGGRRRHPGPVADACAPRSWPDAASSPRPESAGARARSRSSSRPRTPNPRGTRGWIWRRCWRWPDGQRRRRRTPRRGRGAVPDQGQRAVRGPGAAGPRSGDWLSRA